MSDTARDHDREFVAVVKNSLGQLNALHTFTTYVLMGIIVSYLYESASGIFSFLPDISISLIVVIVLFLTLAGSYLSRSVTKQVISNVNEYSNSLAGVISFSAGLREEDDTATVFKKITESAVALTNSDAGTLMLVDNDSLIIKSAVGDLPELGGMSIPLGQGISGWVAEHASPLYQEDVRKSSGFDSSLEWVADINVVSVLCMPLMAHGKVVGILELVSGAKGNYSDKDMEMATYLGGHVAVIMERARCVDRYDNYESNCTEILVDAIIRVMPPMGALPSDVERYSVMLAGKLGLSGDELKRVRYAALLHDIGYIRAFSFLGSEADTLKKHVSIGSEMLGRIDAYRAIADIVLHHHERYDGKGFPSGLEESAIPLESRIISIADTFASMLGRRAGNSMSEHDALDGLLALSGSQLDPFLVDTFAHALREHAEQGSPSVSG